MSNPTFLETVSKATGWSRDFTGDLLGAAGAGAFAFLLVMWLTGQLLLLVNPFLWIAVAAGSIITAMVWKRNRRDNQ